MPFLGNLGRRLRFLLTPLTQIKFLNTQIDLANRSELFLLATIPTATGCALSFM